MIEEIFLTDEKIIERLKELGFDNANDEPKCGCLWLIMPNTEYDPNNFSQEIEDSEKEINWVKEMNKKVHEPGFDFVWNNTLGEIKKNSDKWLENHKKNCTSMITHFWYQIPMNAQNVLEGMLNRIKKKCKEEGCEGVYYIS